MGATERSVAGAPVAARIAASTGLSGWFGRGSRAADRRADVGCLDGDRRHEEDDDGVDARVGEDQGRAEWKCSAVAEPSMSTGFATEASAGSARRGPRASPR